MRVNIPPQSKSTSNYSLCYKIEVSSEVPPSKEISPAYTWGCFRGSSPGALPSCISRVPNGFTRHVMVLPRLVFRDLGIFVPIRRFLRKHGAFYGFTSPCFFSRFQNNAG